jgi:RND family efflux transporter MFP subunit
MQKKVSTSTRYRLLALALAGSAVTPHSLAASVDCLIEPTQTVEIRSPVSGLLDTINVHRGDKVTKGQVIASLESSVERAAADVAKHKAQMTGPIKVAQTKFDFAKKTYERRRDMQAKNLMSGQDKEDAERDMAAAEAELQLAQENRRLAELEYQEQNSTLERKTIRSPLTGVVVDQLFAGEMVEPGDSKKPIFKLAQLDPLRVHAVMPRSAFGSVKRAMVVDVEPEMPTGARFKGTVKIVAPLIDGASGTFAVYLEAPNPTLAIPAGIRCKANFTAITN